MEYRSSSESYSLALIVSGHSVAYLDILEYAEIRLGILCHKVELELGALDTTQNTLEHITDIASFLNRQCRLMTNDEILTRA